MRQKGAYRILCLGESTTANEYPPFLEEALNRHNMGIRFSVIDKGVDSIDTSAILASLESNLNAYRPKMVITMMGINDWGPHMPHETVSSSQVISFTKSLRTYKLARLLWLHIVTRLNSSLASNIDSVYTELAGDYRVQGRLSEAEAAAKKAIELKPDNDMAYAKLAWVYRNQGRLLEAEAAAKKAIELNPNNYGAYSGLGWIYHKQDKAAESEAAFKKAVKLNPSNDWAYIQLGWSYYKQGRLSEAESAFKKAAECNPNSYMAYAALKLIYSDTGNTKLAGEYDKKADDLILRQYLPMTAENLRKLRAILKKRGIAYVCVQYPMRSLRDLKRVFQEDSEGIIFVDNEKIFKDALRQGGYRDYFIDTFGGDFGHCTAKGNRLLAENIAQVIVKEIFNK